MITGSQTATLSGHIDVVVSAVFSSDGRSLVSGSDDRTVKLWDMQTGGAIKIFSGHTEIVHSASISVDCTTIASGSHDTHDIQDIKIAEDGSRVFSAGPRVIQAQSIQTGKIVGKAGIKFLKYNIPSLTVHGSRVWVHYPAAGSQVWDFGTLDSPPVQLANTPLHIFHPTGIMLWDTGPSCVKEQATGKVVFWLSKGYGKPVDVQWNNQYLFVSFISGEVLILDFSHVLPLLVLIVYVFSLHLKF